MPDRHPLVSVVMPFLNEARYLREAIESVRAQTYPTWELLLVDDGSTDGSSEIAVAYAGRDPERVRYLTHENRRNRGTGPSRNLGLELGRGELVAFLDGDDFWLPFKLERQVPLLLAHPEVDLLYGNTLHTYYPAPVDGARDYLQRIGVEPETVVAPPDLLTMMLADENIHPAICSLLGRRSVCLEVGGFPDELGSMYEDTGFLSSIFLRSKVLVTGECSAVYRMHDDSACTRALASGEYHLSEPNQARGRYLSWLERHLTERTVTDEQLWGALRDQLAPYRRSADEAAQPDALDGVASARETTP